MVGRRGNSDRIKGERVEQCYSAKIIADEDSIGGMVAFGVLWPHGPPS